ncbi:MAG: S46 family peptidase [Thermoanaerobaculia bacterium]|nr:S46 family peptidase [Thermoanaerobaculia bacterium]
MWMSQQIPDLAPRLTELGFTGDAKIWADLTGFPMGAVISLGGCSASFVSPDGLIATNHHCVQGSLQYNSTPERNLIVDGYLARTREEELSNGPGSRVWVTVSVKEVTDEITGKLAPKLTDRQRYDAIERRIKERTAACEKDGLRCRVASFFEGLRYFEIAQLEIDDVRLVYAPPQGIGNYGGETDNWQWPRHTGDFSFYRAYVGKDGRPAAYSKENVPYRPKHFLKISPKGASPGEPIFVAGYPGRTQRHETFAEVKERTEWGFPRYVRRNREMIAILEETTKGHKDLAIKAEPRMRGLQNGMKKNEGVLAGLLKGGILARKEANQKALEAWIAADPARQKEYGDVLPALAAMQAESEKTRERDAVLAGLYQGSTLLGTADSLYRLSLERPKKDLDRDPSFQERNWARTKEGLERMQRTYDNRLDRPMLRYALLEASALPADQRIAPVDALVGLAGGMPKEDAAKKIDAYLDALYAGTKLPERDFRLSLFEKSTKEIVATNDTAVQLAVALHPMAEANRERAKANDGKRSLLRPRYMRALLAQGGGLVAPDANSTLRVTFGRVQGVDPRDGMRYLPQTTLQGVVDKHTGEGEFDSPARLLEAVKALRAGKKTPYFDEKLGDVPVNFMSDVDTTGGNSGSAVLNSQGELVGLLFDGTLETVASDFLFDTEKTRSIQVDSRYLLWVWSEVEGAKNLLDEVGIK